MDMKEIERLMKLPLQQAIGEAYALGFMEATTRSQDKKEDFKVDSKTKDHIKVQEPNSFL